jgi:hypothetical protein
MDDGLLESHPIKEARLPPQGPLALPASQTQPKIHRVKSCSSFAQVRQKLSQIPFIRIDHPEINIDMKIIIFHFTGK